jgi:hypothetical protein
MNAFQPYLAAIHLQELLDEASFERRARLARKAGSAVPGWRRNLGGLFASAARSIDPSVETPAPGRSSSKESGARAFAA